MLAKRWRAAAAVGALLGPAIAAGLFCAAIRWVDLDGFWKDHL